MKAKAAKDFDLAKDCRTTVHVKNGDIVEVDEASVPGMVAAEQIEEPEGNNYSKELEKQMTTKSDEGEAGGAEEEGDSSGFIGIGKKKKK